MRIFQITSYEQLLNVVEARLISQKIIVSRNSERFKEFVLQELNRSSEKRCG